MRKLTVILFALFVLLPSLANAWTLATTVSGRGSVAISAYEPPRILRTVTGGTGYAYPSGTVDATALITPNTGYAIQSVTLNGLDKIADVDTDGNLAVPYNGTPQTLGVVFGLVGSGGPTTYSVTVTQAPNVTVSVKRIAPTTSPSSYTSLTGLSYGDTVQVTAQPAAGYKVLSITIGGTTTYPGTATGVAAMQSFSVTGNTVVSAASELVANISVSLSAPLNGLSGSAITATASAVTNNGPPTYAFAVTGPEAFSQADGSAKTFSFTPTLAGEYAITVTATSANRTASANATANVSVQNKKDYENGMCYGCHTKTFPVVIAEYEASRHNTALLESISCVDCHEAPHTFLPTSDTCSGCHTQLQVGAKHLQNDMSCLTCHNEHIFKPATDNCYSCHQDIASTTHDIATVADYCQRCHDTHTLEVTGAGLASHFGGAFNGTAAQYVAQNADCSDCHANGVIYANREILAEFAASSHADTSSPAWITTTSHDWPVSSCKSCHSTTGFIDSVTGSSTAVEPGQPGQILACNGCHESVVTGEVRDPGAFTATYSANGITTTVDFPDAGPSNICLNCHSGRRSGAQITEAATTTPHGLAAGGTLFNAIGYEFTDRDYAGGYHRTVGINDNLGSGNAGSCVACHMSTGYGHNWSVVTTDAGGSITAITSGICGSCHSDMTVAKLDGKKVAYRAMLDCLKAVMAAKGVHYFDGSFYTAPYTEGGNNILVDNAYYGVVAAAIDGANGSLPAPSKQDLQGAAFNLYLLDYSDPAAYVHNRGYAFDLLTDSIDLFNDGALNDDAVAAIQALNLPQETRDAAVDAIENPEDWTHPTLTESDASPTVCGGCHDSSPHYGGVAFTTADQNPAPRAQYVAQYLDCLDCHAADAFTPDASNAEFAESGHGNVDGEAWKHYDWAQPDRVACQRCHTTTGLLNDVTGSATILATGEPGQVLACIGCHESFSLTGVRNPGPFQATFTNDHPTVPSNIFPDRGTSNICIRCHSGLAGGSTIAGSSANFADTGFIQPHYLAAAGVLFRTGYHYYARAYYANPAGNHTGIGEGDGGPCAHCHMVVSDLPVEVKHTLDVVARDASGDITAITTGVCNAAYCHAGITPAFVDGFADGFSATLEALKDQLAASGIHYYPAYPYLFADVYDPAPGASNAAVVDWTLGGTRAGKHVMGAAFNFILLKAEPGGYAHNPTYARRLLFDSIDYLDNGVLNLSIDLSAHAEAAAYLKPAAPASAVTRP